MSDIQLTAEEETPQLLDFDSAELVPLEPPGSGAMLRVRGQAPCMNMKVRLSPVRYIQQPDYWVIHVVGDLHGGVCLEAVRDFDEVLAPAPLGKAGVVVVGETKRERLENP
jgi:hypothetical protein